MKKSLVAISLIVFSSALFAKLSPSKAPSAAAINLTTHTIQTSYKTLTKKDLGWIPRFVYHLFHGARWFG